MFVLEAAGQTGRQEATEVGRRRVQLRLLAYAAKAVDEASACMHQAGNCECSAIRFIGGGWLRAMLRNALDDAGPAASQGPPDLATLQDEAIRPASCRD